MERKIFIENKIEKIPWILSIIFLVDKDEEKSLIINLTHI